MGQRIAAFLFVIGISSAVLAQVTPTSSQAPAPGSNEAAAAEGDLTSKAETPVYLICKSKALVRTLRVQNRPKGKCITTYTKNGVDQIVSNSSSLSQCSKVLSNIRENLEKANWKCKDISEARVSSWEG